MPRQRMIQPGIWIDEGFLSLSIQARLLFIGMISGADDEGRGLATDRCLKARIFPADDDVTLSQIRNYRDEVAAAVNVTIYEVDGKTYYQCSKWQNHQRLEHPSQSIIPAPDFVKQQEVKIPTNRSPSKKKAIPTETRKAIAIRYGVNGPGESKEVPCPKCGKVGSINWMSAGWVHFKDLELDHKIPESAGGDNSPSNIDILCRSCNRVKSTSVVIPDSQDIPPAVILRNELKELDKELKIDSRAGARPIASSENVAKVVSYLNEKTGRSYNAGTKATTRLVLARIRDGHHFVDFKAVIDNRVQVWGGDPKMAEYLRPETLFGTKFDSYLATAGAPKMVAAAGTQAWTCAHCGHDNHHTGGMCLKCKEARDA